MTGNVIINITANLTGETGTVALNQWAEEPVASSFTVTIKPSGGARAITGTGTNSTVIKLNGADIVTIDGSLSGGTDRSLTISNPNSATGTTVLWIGSLGAGAGATNNTIKNCIISAGTVGSSTVTTFAIFVGDTTGSANGADNDGLTVQNNQIKKATYGIQAVGGATAGQQNDNLLVLGNTIGDAVVADSIGRFGILVGQATNATISQNTVQNVVTSDSGISSTNNATGMLIGTGVTSSSITRNNITGVRYTSTGGYGGKGIDINTGNAASNLLVANNSISDIRGDGWSSLSGDSIVGMRILGTTGGINLYYNSVNLGSGSFAGNSSGTLSAALYVDSTTSGLNIRNNIFATNLVNSNAASAKSYAIATNASSGALFTAINYNDYYASGTQGVLGLLNAVDRTTLAAWQTATGQDANSISADPLFVSTTDLHINAGTNYDPLPPVSHTGAPLAAVTSDFDGATRDAGTPDIGADEFTVNRTPTSSGTFSAGNYDDVTVGSPAVATAGGNLTIFGNLLVNAGGTLDVGTNSITSVGGTVTNNGTLKQTKTVAASGTTSFLTIPAGKYYGVDITGNGTTALGSTTVYVSGNRPLTGTCPDIASGSRPVRRCYLIDVTTSASASATFYYTFAELRTDLGQSAGNLKVWRNTSGTAWAQLASTPNATCGSGQLNCSVQATSFTPTRIDGAASPEDTTDDYVLMGSNPQAVTLADFSAAQTGDAVLLTWETNSELENRGFNLYRGTDRPSEPDRQLNETLIPSQSQGNPGGFIYTWEDRADLVPGTTYYYWVEDVDIYGTATRHGPVSVDYGAPTAVRLLDAGAVTTLPLALPLIGAGLLALAGWPRPGDGRRAKSTCFNARALEFLNFTSLTQRHHGAKKRHAPIAWCLCGLV